MLFAIFLGSGVLAAPSAPARKLKVTGASIHSSLLTKFACQTRCLELSSRGLSYTVAFARIDGSRRCPREKLKRPNRKSRREQRFLHI